MQLNVPAVAIHVTTLTVIRASKLLVTEHSDLGNYIWQPLYDDACDVGLALYNPTTGVTTRWALSEEILTAEKELVKTSFRPCSETLAKHPSLKDWMLVVFND